MPVNHRRTIAGFKCRPVNVRSDDEPVTDIGMAQAVGDLLNACLAVESVKGFIPLAVILFSDGLVGFMEKFEELCGRFSDGNGAT